jgi:hypothetical protein
VIETHGANHVRFEGNNGQEVDARRCLLMTQNGLSALASGGVATFAGEGDNLAREDCNTLSQCSYISYWRAGPEALTVETIVPITCTPPFPKFSAVERSQKPQDSRLQPAKHRLRAM